MVRVYQFKVTLLETDPPVWRRLQVPNCYTFWYLHCAVTDAFGWLDCGGTWGYQRFKKSIAYHNGAEHDELLEWAGGWFAPDWFDKDLLRFEDPFTRWDITFLDKPRPKGMREVRYHQMNFEAIRAILLTDEKPYGSCCDKANADVEYNF